MGSSNSLERIRNQKINQRDNLLKDHLKMIDSKLLQLNVTNTLTEKILNASACELVNMLNHGVVNSQQITAVYSRKAGTTGAKLCLITEDNFAEAMQVATELDQVRRTSGKKNWTFTDPYDLNKFLPPLFGIPISVKDTIVQKGFACTIGITQRANKIQQSDGIMVRSVRNSGMIPFVRSNVPQLAMTFESNNFLWGRAVNPWNTNRATGGSSGGQGGLIAARCSPLGMGSDIGGSLRIPAQFCGITTIKPASGRLSYSGHTPFIDSLDGNPIVPGCMGPLARSVDDLALWMKSVLDKNSYGGQQDQRIYYIPFDERKYLEAQKTRYRIGFIPTFEISEATAASQRAVRQTAKVLHQLGHQVVEMKLLNEKDIVQTFSGFLVGEGNLQSYRKMLQGEDLIPQYNTIDFLTKLSTKCYCCYCCIQGIMSKTQPRVGWSMDIVSPKTTHYYLTNAGKIKRLRQDWLNYLRKENIDFVIAPGFGSQATINNTSADCPLPAAYTSCWNLLDVPVGSLPITLTKADQQVYQSRHQDDFTKIMMKNAQNSQGLPAGVQVVGVNYDEERILGVMKAIEQKIMFNQRYGGPKIGFSI